MQTPDLEDIYPLSPLQQGLLFHTLAAPSSGVYFQQLSCELHGRLDVAAFRRSWLLAVDRHSLLRTAFLWEGLDEPLQVVHRRVEIPFTYEDWRQVAREEQQERLVDHLRRDVEQGFALSEPPLMRLGLFRLQDEAYHLVWSHHHLLLDGWSVYPLVQEVLATYEASLRGETLRLDRKSVV